MEDENAALKVKLVERAASQAVAIGKLEAHISKLEAQHKDAIRKLEAENAALTDILAAVTTGAMEILPVRLDSRQFVEWRVGGIPPPPPPPPQFVGVWCAVACADRCYRHIWPRWHRCVLIRGRRLQAPRAPKFSGLTILSEGVSRGGRWIMADHAASVR
jgi:hypothetical protein